MDVETITVDDDDDVVEELSSLLDELSDSQDLSGVLIFVLSKSQDEDTVFSIGDVDLQSVENLLKCVIQEEEELVTN